MTTGISSQLERLQKIQLLDALLRDKTTRENLIWATDAYTALGDDYRREREITSRLITGDNAGVICSRADKATDAQSQRTKQHAEVFTPFWICERMIDHIDADWFGRKSGFGKTDENGRVFFTKKRKWQHYVDSRRLEITCGEAPYLVSRYDAATGEEIPIERRTGILDRKLRAVCENAKDEEEWLNWAFRAFQQTYGYEFQGDNLLIARVNLLCSFEDYLYKRWQRKPTEKEYGKISNIICWNLWQMDGLTGTLPYCTAEEEEPQIGWEAFSAEPEEKAKKPTCKVYDWRRDNSVEFISVNKGERPMKFDYIIGNPPYQDETANEGDRKPPIYHKFMDSCYEISDVVELIHPARFLFNAGQTPKAWNQQMLENTHFMVNHYEPDASIIFPNTEIKGGVVISTFNKNKEFGAIGTFTPYDELNTIVRRIRPFIENTSLSDIVSSRGNYRFSDRFFEAFPDAKNRVGDGTGNMIVSNIFERIPEAFECEIHSNQEKYISILGRKNNRRTILYLLREYVQNNDFIDCYKLMIPEANGNGQFGEVISGITYAAPGMGATDTFLSLGRFNSNDECINLEKYLKTKTLRALLGIKKVTQHAPQSVWKYVPLQDFTPSSDIDWTKSIHEIDLQLYAKYALTEEEIDFIESHVKEMA